MYMDPLYWLLIGAGMLLSLWAQFRVKSAYARYAQVASRSGLTGADVAKAHPGGQRDQRVRVEASRAEPSGNCARVGSAFWRPPVCRRDARQRARNEALRIKRLA